MDTNLLIYALVIFLAAFLGGVLMLLKKWSDDLLHIFVSFGAGIFIGTVFLHLLPEALQTENHALSAPFVIVGFMFIFFIERFLFLKKGVNNENNHKVISITAMLGLSVHSIIAGIGLAIGSEYEGLEKMLFYSIIAHKTTAAFALTSLFLLAKLNWKKCLYLLALFSLMTPIGILVFSPMVKSADVVIMDSLLGLTAGTFLYVSVGELLPEVFHTYKNKWLKLILLILGIVIVAIIGENAHF